ncbi:phosphotransferase family protein [Actinoplanes sp. NPDC020271]|uniref:phosphotransferase family protein n=1 Tax=Actinoplanes sp. NPDC020271 TaxID=3363896 RepID=UPI0037A3FB56
MPDVRLAMATALPGFTVESVSVLGEGLDNVAFEINNDLLVRFSRSSDRERTLREVGLLTALRPVSPLPIPEPLFGPDEAGQNCFAYRKLPGVPLLDAPACGDPERIVATLADFLRTLHAVPVDQVRHLVETDDQPLPEWRDDAAETYSLIADHVPARFRRPVEAFLADAPPPGPAGLVFSHNDLGIEHVLVDPRSSQVTGIIDWTDAALTDPAYDFGLLFRDLGPLAAPPPELHDRAVFYARCSLLEDLAYGIEAGRPRYAEKSLASLDWLFPPPGAGGSR